MEHYPAVCWFYNPIALCFGSHTAGKHTTGVLCKLAVNKVSGMRYVCNNARGWLMVTETLGDERGEKKIPELCGDQTNPACLWQFKDNGHRNFDLRVSSYHLLRKLCKHYCTGEKMVGGHSKGQTSTKQSYATALQHCALWIFKLMVLRCCTAVIPNPGI